MKRPQIVYQSAYFDFYLQFYPEWRTILFNNKVEGIILQKTTLKWRQTYAGKWHETYRGYGVYFNMMLLGIRFGVYFAPFQFKIKY